MNLLTRFYPVVALAIVGFCGCHRQTIAEQATVLARDVCSNSIPGINRIVSVTMNQTNDLAWRGEAAVDFVNQVGGIDRTNVPLLFTHFDSKPLTCELDTIGIAARESERLFGEKAR